MNAFTLLAIMFLALVGACSESETSIPKVTPDEGTTTEPDTGPDVSAPSATTLVVEPALLAVERGRTGTLVATAFDENGETLSAPIDWSSSDEAVAEVTPSGIVVGHEFGVATVTASTGMLRAEAQVRITGPPVQRIAVSPASRQMAVGDTVTMTVTMFDAQNAPIDDARDVVFASTNDAVVTVDATGLVTAVSEGSASIETTVESISATSEFVVFGADPIDRVEVMPVSFEVVRGETVELTAAAFVGGAAVPGVSFTWTSDDAAVASVDGQGVVLGLKKGEATITASARGIDAQSTARVTFGFTDLAVGADFACGLVAGRVYCWGRNDAGQLGRADSSTSAGPVDTTLRFDDVVANTDTACARTSAGAAHCWGSGASAVVAVPGGHAFSRLFAGYGRVCGVEGQTLWCWGPGATPTSSGTYDATALGVAHQCAVGAAGAFCWGSNARGQLGINATGGTFATPQTISGGFDFATLVAGRDHTCGTTPSGAALCWGANESGQLGDAGTTDRVTPILLGGGVQMSRLTAGDSHTCGLAAGGVAYCWGNNTSGLLGTGGGAAITIPTSVPTAVRFSELAAGDRFTCGLSLDGDPYCWGLGNYGQSGEGGATTVPRLIEVTP